MPSNRITTGMRVQTNRGHRATVVRLNDSRAYIRYDGAGVCGWLPVTRLRRAPDDWRRLHTNGKREARDA